MWCIFLTVCIVQIGDNMVYCVIIVTCVLCTLICDVSASNGLSFKKYSLISSVNVAILHTSL